MKLLPFLLFAMIVPTAFSQMPPIEPGVSHELAIWRATRYSDVRYKLNLTLEKMSPVLKGTIEIRVKVSPQTGETSPIILDWRKLAGHENDSTISNISLNGLDVVIDHPGGPDVGGPTCSMQDEHIVFQSGTQAGENVIKLDFTSPILTSGSAITRYVDKEDGSEYLYSLFVPSDASTAFPVFDQPDLKARFSVHILAPDIWKVVSNTQPINIHQTEDYTEIAKSSTSVTLEKSWVRIWSFAETKPISTYVFAFAAGPWVEQSEPPAVAGGLTQPRSTSKESSGNLQPAATAAGSDSVAWPTIHIYVRKSQEAKFQPHAAEVFKLTREGVKYLEEYFDYKFPWPKYDLVLIPEFPFGGMEHAGATFLRETGVIFPSEPTANDYISRANLIFHETAHQWFGDTVTMRWFDDLWLKEGFAEFMAYKTLERVMPQYNAWKAFYERNKQAAYLTDSTMGTTPIYQEINNLSAAKSAYGNIVYRKAPSFLRQAEFYLGPDKFQTGVRAFFKKHEFANATWQDLVREFETTSGRDLKEWASNWVTKPGVLVFKQLRFVNVDAPGLLILIRNTSGENIDLPEKVSLLYIQADGSKPKRENIIRNKAQQHDFPLADNTDFVFANYQDYGYGIFLLDDTSRDYVLKNIQNEKDDFLRSMMWGALWDSVREAELNPRDYVELAIKNLPAEKDETITASVLGRVSTAMTYYMPDKQRDEIAPRLETMLAERMGTAPTVGQKITFYRAFLTTASTSNARDVLKLLVTKNPLAAMGGSKQGSIPLKTKDRFDIVTRLAVLGDPDAPKLLADLEKTETSDDAKRYAFAAHAAFATKENREKFWNDFVGNKDVSESWIEAAMVPFNSPRHSELTLPYLQRALAELPNLKRNRKIFFVNGWLGAFIGGQKSQAALDIVNKFLADNPNLDRDLRLKILENVDIIERAVKIRAKY